MKGKRILLLSTVVLMFVWWQGRSNLYHPHLQVDTWISWQRISYYLEHGSSLVGMSGNEILPATMLYIMLPMLLIPEGWVSYSSYLPLAMVLNLGVLALAIWQATNKRVILALLLFFGPILLFRFDGFVVLLVTSSLLAYEKKRYGLAGLTLGLATGMKVYPLILLPLLILILGYKKYRESLALCGAFVLSLTMPVVGHYLMGGNYNQLVGALSFHSDKLISIESVAGSVITLVHQISYGTPPELLPGNGIWSVAGPVEVFNKLWVVPILLVYYLIYRKKKHNISNLWQGVITLTLVFLVFAKNLNPQYVWWYLALLAFMKPSKWVIVMSLMVGIANQLVYPVFYTTLIEDFYRLNQSSWVYYLLLVRNLLIILTALHYLKELIKNEKGSNG